MSIIIPSQDILLHACTCMPLFPLPRVVLFPGTLLRLHVFEPRYVQLLEKIQEEEGLFSIPMIRMSTLAVQDPELHPVAGIGKVVHCTALPENRYNSVVLGVGRIRIEQEHTQVDLYRTAQGRLLREETENFDVVPLKQLLTQIIMRDPSLSKTLSLLLDESLVPRTFLNTVAQLILSDADERQKFLEVESVHAQGDLLSEKLAEVLLDGISFNE